MKTQLKLNNGEEIIKIAKPHSASFLSSPTFWIGVLLLFLCLPRGLLANFALIRLFLGISGLLLIGLAYVRRVSAYKFHFTNKRIISDYSFLRKAHREIGFDNIIDVKIIQGIFGKVCGYADVWIYGYQGGWVVGRMRGVSLGDSEIIANRAWKNKFNSKK